MIDWFLTTKVLPLPPASAIHHADRFGVVISEFSRVDLVFFERTKVFQDWNCLGTRGNGVFVIAFREDFLRSVTAEEFDEFDGVSFIGGRLDDANS